MIERLGLLDRNLHFQSSMVVHTANEVDTTDRTRADSTAYGLVDMTELARVLADLEGALPPSYVDGKTVLRDRVMDYLGCSAAKAERIVDQLEERGHIRFDGPRARRPRREPRWYITAERAVTS